MCSKLQVKSQPSASGGLRPIQMRPSSQQPVDSAMPKILSKRRSPKKKKSKKKEVDTSHFQPIASAATAVVESIAPLSSPKAGSIFVHLNSSYNEIEIRDINKPVKLNS